jgi:hypothetical protein
VLCRTLQEAAAAAEAKSRQDAAAAAKKREDDERAARVRSWAMEYKVVKTIYALFVVLQLTQQNS